ncbi:hypothetical protein NBRC116588_25220 [Pyruvatibacter sp. HU-CL02332]|uniref:hypothetical protein n=1 Tax=Pyruvatibacter sp. HU-CL02332 TaxID=3127650 RepID=UPI003103D6CE
MSYALPAKLLIALFAIALSASASLADEKDALPRCEPSSLGATACMQGVLCECTQVRGGTITGELSGVKWNCDALRPRCGDEASVGDGGVPATIPPVEFPYPHSVGIDRSQETTIIRQNQTANPDNTNVNVNN